MMLLGIHGKAGVGKDLVSSYFVNNHDFIQLSFADPFKEFCRTVFDWDRTQLWGPSQYRNDVDGRYRESRKTVGTTGSSHHEYDAAWGAAHHQLVLSGKEFIRDILTHGYPHYGELTKTEKETLQEACYTELIAWFRALSSTHASTLSPRVALQSLGSEWGRKAIDENVWVNYLLSRAREAIVSKDYRGVVVSDIRFENELLAVKDAGGKLLHIVRPESAPLAAGIENHASERQELDHSMFNFNIKNDGSVKDLFNDIKICAMCLGITSP